jgi:hypothetical protein
MKYFLIGQHILLEGRARDIDNYSGDAMIRSQVRPVSGENPRLALSPEDFDLT